MVQLMKNIPTGCNFSNELIKTVGAIPTSYLIYYYHRDEQLAKAKDMLKNVVVKFVWKSKNNYLILYSNSELHE